MNGDSSIKTVRGRAVPVRGDDIDTDRIIPARYMRVVTFDGLGEFAFRDVRFGPNGERKEHPFNDPRFAGAGVLLVGRNFGCGSSREHAPQALYRWGIRAVLGVSFADIFAGNCAAIGLVAARVSPEDAEKLQAAAEATPAGSASPEIVVDLEAMSARLGSLSVPIELPESRRRNFLAGSWDTTATLLAGKAEIERVAARLPYCAGF